MSQEFNEEEEGQDEPARPLSSMSNTQSKRKHFSDNLQKKKLYFVRRTVNSEWKYGVYIDIEIGNGHKKVVYELMYEVESRKVDGVICRLFKRDREGKVIKSEGPRNTKEVNFPYILE